MSDNTGAGIRFVMQGCAAALFLVAAYWVGPTDADAPHAAPAAPQTATPAEYYPARFTIREAEQGGHTSNF